MTPLRGSLVILLALTGAPSSSAAPSPAPTAPVVTLKAPPDPALESAVRVEVGPSVAIVYDDKGSVIAVE